jgi:hypothetical protein
MRHPGSCSEGGQCQRQFSRRSVKSAAEPDYALIPTSTTEQEPYAKRAWKIRLRNGCHTFSGATEFDRLAVINEISGIVYPFMSGQIPKDTPRPPLHWLLRMQGFRPVGENSKDPPNQPQQFKPLHLDTVWFVFW